MMNLPLSRRALLGLLSVAISALAAAPLSAAQDQVLRIAVEGEYPVEIAGS